MELREYLSIRRAYNLVRQDMSAKERLTFAELAILCYMSTTGQEMKTSEIARYQGALRPTMTHRTKHLARLDLISRSKGGSDHRNVVCAITSDGEQYVGETCAAISKVLSTGTVFSRTTPQRISQHIVAMGTFPCLSSDLVLLAIIDSDSGRRAISELISTLGLLQPTVSMSVSSLVEDGLVERVKDPGERVAPIVLTESGAARAQELRALIRSLAVRRKTSGADVNQVAKEQQDQSVE